MYTDVLEFVGVDNTINSEEVPVTETPAFTEALSFGKGCAEVGNARAYRGTASTTYRGLTCQHWDSMHPHSHKYRYDAKRLNWFMLLFNSCERIFKYFFDQIFFLTLQF